jgi:hypothetical protein
MERWLRNLNLYVWRFKGNDRNYPGFHLTADLTACEALIRVFDVLLSEGSGSQRATLLKPTPEEFAHRVGPRDLRVKSLEKISLRLLEPTDELRQICFSQEGGMLLCEVTTAWLPILRECVETLMDGGDDFSIGPYEGRKSGYQMGERDKRSDVLSIWNLLGIPRKRTGW